MKSKVQSCILSALTFLALAISVVNSPVRAMAQDITLTRAQIPFSFHVGSTVMPAGDYTFSQTNIPTVLRLIDHATGQRIFAPMRGDNRTLPQAQGAISFTRYEGQYYLRGVDVPNRTLSYKCTYNKAEKALARAMRDKNGAQMAVNVEPVLPR